MLHINATSGISLISVLIETTHVLTINDILAIFPTASNPSKPEFAAKDPASLPMLAQRAVFPHLHFYELFALAISGT